jgi:hypothetical protein
MSLGSKRAAPRYTEAQFDHRAFDFSYEIGMLCLGGPFRPAFSSAFRVCVPDMYPPKDVPGAFSWAFSFAFDRDDLPPPEPIRDPMIFEWWNREGGIDRAWYVGNTFADAFDVRGRRP